MCELFCVSSDRKIKISPLLETFFSHSDIHKNGWGIALLDRDPPEIEKEPVKALDSSRVKEILKEDICTSCCIAHIRYATIGIESLQNTHPFTGRDETGRQWVQAHNGTLFEAPALSPFQYVQQGSTDSERLLLYLIDRINRREKEAGDTSDPEVRIHIVEDVILTNVPGNKVNLILSDGEFLYIHTNERRTLYRRGEKGCLFFATRPLDDSRWEEAEQNTLLVYKDGNLRYRGEPHEHTYVFDEERMKPLYLAYSGL